MFGRDRKDRSDRSSQSRFTSDDRTYSMNDRNYDPVYNQRSDSGREERDRSYGRGESDGLYGGSGYDRSERSGSSERSERFAGSRGYRGYEDYPGTRQGRKDFGSFEQDRDRDMDYRPSDRGESSSDYREYGSYRGEYSNEPQQRNSYMGRPGLTGANANARFSSPSSQGYRSYQDYGSSSSAMGRSWSGTDDGASQGYGASQGSYGTSRDMNYGYQSQDPQYRTQADYRGQESRGHSGKGPKGYKRSDEKIHDEVCDLLTTHYDIDASELEVEVKEGVVTLGGAVESRRIKRLAEDLVADMNGVKDVRNQIKVLSHDSRLLDTSSDKSSAYRASNSSTDSTLGSSSASRSTKSSSTNTSSTPNRQ